MIIAKKQIIKTNIFKGYEFEYILLTFEVTGIFKFDYQFYRQ